MNQCERTMQISNLEAQDPSFSSSGGVDMAYHCNKF